MEGQRLAVERQREIRDFLLVLAQENQRSIVQLMADGIIKSNKADFLVTCGISESEFDKMWQQVLSGANPFATWMLANGYTNEQIDQIYQIIDRWLVKTELNFPTNPDDSNLN
jgi:hypothetical protein